MYWYIPIAGSPAQGKANLISQRIGCSQNLNEYNNQILYLTESKKAQFPTQL